MYYINLAELIISLDKLNTFYLIKKKKTKHILIKLW